jgi:Ser/Thr protein kinase RdoA (MazF antagonist)
VRLISFLPGVFRWAVVKRHADTLLNDLGRRVGQLDLALADFDHPAAHRDLHWDLANAQREINRHKALITDPDLRALVDTLTANFKRDVAPLLPTLRRSVIQNDANDYNVIVGGGDDHYSRNQQVIGLIDFGDMVYSVTVADLAIAAAYAALNKPDPLAAAAQVVAGYHAEYPLTDDEITALPGLICIRLCLSVCMSAYPAAAAPQRPLPEPSARLQSAARCLNWPKYTPVLQKPFFDTLAD